MMAMSNYYGQTPEDKAAMNLPFAMHLHGELDVKQLEKAIEKVTQLKIMNTYISVEQNKFFANEKEILPFSLKVENVEGTTQKEKIGKVIELTQKEGMTPLPLFEKEKRQYSFRLFKIEEEYHILTMILHHTFLDFGAVMIVISYIFGFYHDDNFKIKECAEASKFMTQELAFFETEGAKKEEEYWKKELTDVAQLKLTVETDSASNADIQEKDLMTVFERKEIENMAVKYRTSVFNIMILIIHMAIAKVNDTNDTLTQYAISNRSDKEYRYTLGCLTRILSNRVNFDDDMNVTELNKLVRKKIGDGYQNRRTAGKTALGSIPYVIANEDMGDLNIVPMFHGKQIPLEFVDIPRKLDFLGILIVPVETDYLGIGILTDTTAYGEHSKKLLEAIILAEKFILNYPDKTFEDFMRKDITVNSLDLLSIDDGVEIIEI